MMTTAPRPADEAARRVERYLLSKGRRRTLFSSAGRLEAVEEAGGARSEYAYDRQGDLVRIVEPDGRSTTFEYDGTRRLTHVTHPDGTSTGYDYRDGHLVGIEDRGVARRFEYDASGRLARSTHGDAGAFVYRHDAGGRLVEARTSTVSTQKSFHPDGRVAVIRQSHAGVTIGLRLEYDATGRLAELHLPGGGPPVRYAWDEEGRPSVVSLGAEPLAHFEYLDGPSRTRVLARNGVVEEAGADPVDGRPAFRRVLGSEGVLFERAYDYDSEGRLVGDGVRRYAYDALDRLVEAEEPSTGRRWRHRYDARDNRTETEGPEDRHLYRHDPAGRLVEILTSEGPIRISYDRLGRPARKAAPDGLWTYRFDSAGRLLAVRRAGRVVARFVYDPDGRLVAVDSDARSERYLYDPDGQLVAVTDKRGTPLRLYVRTPLGLLAEVHGDTANGTVGFQHQGHGGLRHLVTGEGGEVLARWGYAPFGAPSGSAGTFLPMFGGRSYYPEVGMYYFGARWYDPDLGRFLTPDTYTGRPDDERLTHPRLPADSQGLVRSRVLADWLEQPRVRNPYAFCANDPVGRIDPDGHWSFGWTLLSVLGAIWTLPNTLFGLFLEITCLVGEVLRWLAYVVSFGNLDWDSLETGGFDVAASDRLDAFALVFEGGWFFSVFKDLWGLTLGNVFFVRKGWEQNPHWGGTDPVYPPAYKGSVSIPRNLSLYEHELRHTKQYGWFGPFFHLGLPLFGVYWWDVILHGYHDAWAERDARDHSEGPEAGTAIPQSAPAPPAQGTVPVSPVLPAISIRHSVGRGGENRAADVRLVQGRLLTLGYLSQQDRDDEAPPEGATNAVAAGDLGATIAAIEMLQREVLGEAAPDGLVGPRGTAIVGRRKSTLAALNRATPRYTPDGYAAVAAARTSIVSQPTRGVTIRALVGNSTAAAGQANFPEDVAAVQRRLVELHYLPPDHAEQPPPGSTSRVPTAGLRQTIAAIREFQFGPPDRSGAVEFWRHPDRGASRVQGTITAGVVAPDDATHRHLNRITTHRVRFPDGEEFRFQDHTVSGFTVDPRGTSVLGSARTTALPDADYLAAGLTRNQTNALRAVSEHEGNFDALNTYDVARVSFGFIQFAGGRGLPPFMALLKSRRPAVFEQAFRSFGIDIEFNVANGEILNTRENKPALVVLDPELRIALRGTAAEDAVRNSERLSAVFMRAGRNLEVQRGQVEAAARHYILNTLAGSARLQAETVGARMDALLPSEKGLATLMDRAIQDGEGPAGTGVIRLAGAMRWVANQLGLTRISQVAERESQVLQQILDDLAADVAAANEITTAASAVRALRQATEAAGGTVAGVLALPEANSARQAVRRAADAMQRKSFTPTRTHIENVLSTQRVRLDFSPAPANIATLRALLSDINTSLGRIVEAGRPHNVNAANARARGRRVQDILRSTLAGSPPRTWRYPF